MDVHISKYSEKQYLNSNFFFGLPVWDSWNDTKAKYFAFMYSAIFHAI